MNEENSQLKESKLTDRNDISDLEKTRDELEELHLEIEQLRDNSTQKCQELERTVERLHLEKDQMLKNEVEKITFLEQRVQELEAENAVLNRPGNESCMRSDLERKIQDLEIENKELSRSRNITEGELRREIKILKRELDELHDLFNRRNENIILAEKVCF